MERQTRMVVLCKDCIFSDRVNEGWTRKEYVCDKLSYLRQEVNPDDYCSHGKLEVEA